MVSHYAEEGDSSAWTVDGSGNWTRYIGGIGGLTAIQTNGGTPILQLENLHGDIVATAAMSETETKLLSTTDQTEYGVPTTSNPQPYSWLGSFQRRTELPTGIVSMGARGYVPQLGRFEQGDPLPGSSENVYAYTSGDPVNSSDTSGEWTSTVTYNYEAAETGEAREAISEHFIEPGAIMPPPLDLQIEEAFIANPPWSAVSASRGGGGCTGTRACAASICGEWPHCSSLQRALASSRSPVAAIIRSPACIVNFAGVRSTCQRVLERAKAEYGADQKHACTEAVGIVGGVIGVGSYGFIGGLIGDRVVGNAAGQAVCT